LTETKSASSEYSFVHVTKTINKLLGRNVSSAIANKAGQCLRLIHPKAQLRNYENVTG